MDRRALQQALRKGATMKVNRAKAIFDKAAKGLAAATSEAFPIGADVAVTMGRARVIGVVVHSGGSWWSRPSEVTIKNLVTGKLRTFSATCKSNRAVMLADHKGNSSQVENV